MGLFLSLNLIRNFIKDPLFLPPPFRPPLFTIKSSPFTCIANVLLMCCECVANVLRMCSATITASPKAFPLTRCRAAPPPRDDQDQQDRVVPIDGLEVRRAVRRLREERADMVVHVRQHKMFGPQRALGPEKTASARRYSLRASLLLPSRWHPPAIATSTPPTRACQLPRCFS
jgi:hypothetical protein